MGVSRPRFKDKPKKTLGFQALQDVNAVLGGATDAFARGATFGLSDKAAQAGTLAADALFSEGDQEVGSTSEEIRNQSAEMLGLEPYEPGAIERAIRTGAEFTGESLATASGILGAAGKIDKVLKGGGKLKGGARWVWDKLIDMGRTNPKEFLKMEAILGTGAGLGIGTAREVLPDEGLGEGAKFARDIIAGLAGGSLTNGLRALKREIGIRTNPTARAEMGVVSDAGVTPADFETPTAREGIALSKETDIPLTTAETLQDPGVATTTKQLRPRQGVGTAVVEQQQLQAQGVSSLLKAPGKGPGLTEARSAGSQIVTDSLTQAEERLARNISRLTPTGDLTSLGRGVREALEARKGNLLQRAKQMYDEIGDPEIDFATFYDDLLVHLEKQPGVRSLTDEEFNSVRTIADALRPEDAGELAVSWPDSDVDQILDQIKVGQQVAKDSPRQFKSSAHEPWVQNLLEEYKGRGRRLKTGRITQLFEAVKKVKRGEGSLTGSQQELLEDVSRHYAKHLKEMGEEFAPEGFDAEEFLREGKEILRPMSFIVDWRRDMNAKIRGLEAKVREGDSQNANSVLRIAYGLRELVDEALDSSDLPDAKLLKEANNLYREIFKKRGFDDPSTEAFQILAQSKMEGRYVKDVAEVADVLVQPGEAAANRFKTLLGTVMRPLDDADKATAEAGQKQIYDAVRDGLLVRLNSIVPNAADLTVKQLDRFKQQYGPLLKLFPDVESDLKNLISARAELNKFGGLPAGQLEKLKTQSQRIAYEFYTNNTPEKALEGVLGGKDPVGNVREIISTLSTAGDDGTALTGFKRAVLDRFARKAGADKTINRDLIGEVNREGSNERAILKELFTDEELKNWQVAENIVKRVRSAEDLVGLQKGSQTAFLTRGALSQQEQNILGYMIYRGTGKSMGALFGFWVPQLMDRFMVNMSQDDINRVITQFILDPKAAKEITQRSWRFAESRWNQLGAMARIMVRAGVLPPEDHNKIQAEIDQKRYRNR